MADQTQTSQNGSNTGLPTFPQVLSGDDLFDAIMSQIEPDLTTKVYPTLEEKYKGETPEQNAERKERYIKAVDEYKKRFAQYEMEWDARFRSAQAAVVASIEEIDRDEEDVQMQSLENSMHTS